MAKINAKTLLVFYVVIVLAASWFTYFRNYSYPPALFWDENYHISSAQKYLEGVMFMELHPPLGKLFVAAGEYLFYPNAKLNSQDLHAFTQTDYIKDIPAGYSFEGVRFFPALFGWLSALVFFFILYLISKNPHTSFLFSSLYIFENAIIVHSRSAMLDSTLLFFALLTVLYFVYLLKKDKATLLNYFILGILAGLTFMVKINGGIVFLVFPFLWWKNRSELAAKALVFGLGIILISCLVWQIHFSLGKKLQENGNAYRASEEYKTIIAEGKTGSILNFPVMLRDNIIYMLNYNKGVPKLDVCKPGENGSYPLGWLVGDKTINYRWEKTGQGVRYLYFMGNPLIWFLALLAVLLSVCLVAARFIFGLEIKNKKYFYLILFFTACYVFYMAAMLAITRVMYIYHYIIPLVFAMFLVFLQFYYLFEERLKKNPKKIYAFLGFLVLIIILTFVFFSPLTYYQPLTTRQFQERNWFGFWHLSPVE